MQATLGGLHLVQTPIVVSNVPLDSTAPAARRSVLFVCTVLTTAMRVVPPFLRAAPRPLRPPSSRPLPFSCCLLLSRLRLMISSRLSARASFCHGARRWRCR